MLLGGCRASGPTSVTVSPERYADAFAQTRDLLREQGFELERVDAREGVISTRPQNSSGFWTPWVTTEQRLGDEVEASLHRTRRTVEVRFRGDGDDRRAADAPVRIDIGVRVERVYQPGVRVNTTSVRLRHVTENPQLVLPRDEPVFAVDHSADRALAATLTRRLADRLGVNLPATPRAPRRIPNF